MKLPIIFESANPQTDFAASDLTPTASATAHDTNASDLVLRPDLKLHLSLEGGPIHKQLLILSLETCQKNLPEITL